LFEIVSRSLHEAAVIFGNETLTFCKHSSNYQHRFSKLFSVVKVEVSPVVFVEHAVLPALARVQLQVKNVFIIVVIFS
jgi:hypothetical protein